MDPISERNNPKWGMLTAMQTVKATIPDLRHKDCHNGIFLPKFDSFSWTLIAFIFLWCFSRSKDSKISSTGNCWTGKVTINLFLEVREVKQKSVSKRGKTNASINMMIVRSFRIPSGRFKTIGAIVFFVNLFFLRQFKNSNVKFFLFFLRKISYHSKRTAENSHYQVGDPNDGHKVLRIPHFSISN